MRPRKGSDPIVFTTNMVIRGLARRIRGSQRRDAHHRGCPRPNSIGQTAPSLLDCHGVGVVTAATLLVTAGDNPDRLHSERSWARLCGVSPVPAGSGKTSRPCPAESWRRPTRQRGALPDRPDPHEQSDPETRNYVQAPPSRRPLHTRDHALPQTLRRAPNVQTPTHEPHEPIQRVGSDPMNRLTHPPWCCPRNDLSTPPAHPPGRCDLIGACHHHGVAQPSPVHPTRKHLDKTAHIGESIWAVVMTLRRFAESGAQPSRGETHLP